jgi:uncharacterized BrkB/YihY/UPF0761 family membrane protein
MWMIINGFYLTLFIGVGIVGVLGDGMYAAWHESPGPALGAFASLFWSIWAVAIVGQMILGGIYPHALFQKVFRRKSSPPEADR